MSYLTQPAYTQAFMSAIATAVTGVNTGNYPPATGYHVYVSNQNGIVDNTTNVTVYNLSDEFQNDAEVTSVTFVAVFTNLQGYSFTSVSFYTQVNGQDFMEVAEFILQSPIQKPSNYVLLLLITFSITTPGYIINAIQDVEELCDKYCVNVNCNSVGGNIETQYLPFSLFNLTFLYLLGINTNVIQQTPDIEQQASQYASCIQNCFGYLAEQQPIAFTVCLLGCQVYLLQNPIFIFMLANKIQNIVQLLPQGINTVYAVDVCRGKVATLNPQNFQNTLNVISPSEIQYVVQFYLPNANQLFNALQIMVSTTTNYNYSLGVLHFVGVPLPSGENFILEVTVSES